MPTDWSPSWQWICALAEQQPRVVAKIAPGIDKSLLPADSQTTWFANEGVLVEASVWFSGSTVGVITAASMNATRMLYFRHLANRFALTMCSFARMNISTGVSKTIPMATRIIVTNEM